MIGIPLPPWATYSIGNDIYPSWMGPVQRLLYHRRDTNFFGTLQKGMCTRMDFTLQKYSYNFAQVKKQVLNLEDFCYISNKFFKWRKYSYTSTTSRLFHPTIWWDWLWNCLNWLYTDFLIQIIHLNFALVMAKKNFK